MAKKKAAAHKPQLVKPTGERKMPKTDVQRFLEEEKERAGKRSEMIAAIIEERDAKMAEYDESLKLLGYSPDVVTRTPRTVKRTRNPEAKCKICNIAGHDARAHRSQGKDKKPFTHDELVKQGLPVAS